MAVNAGSNTISVMEINDVNSLELVDQEPPFGTGPNSLAFNDGLVYVNNIDADGEFNGEPDQRGSNYGETFESGDLAPQTGARRNLENRPVAVRFAPDGEHPLIISINSGSSALASDDQGELVVYSIDDAGFPSMDVISGTTSTLRGNTEGRNLPLAFGFEVVDTDLFVPRMFAGIAGF